LVAADVRAERLDIAHLSRHQKEGGGFSFRYLLWILRRIWELRSVLRDSRYDVLYIVPGSSLLALLRDALITWVADGAVDRVVAHVRTGDYGDVVSRRGTRLVSAGTIRRIDTFIFLSDALRDRATAVPPSKRVVIRNPIDRQVRFSGADVERKIRGAMRRPTVTVSFISNMFESKGYLDVVEALGLLADSPSWAAEFAGAWPTEAEGRRFLARLRELKIAPRVRAHGAVSDRAEIRNILERTDIFVLPTYYPREAQPRAIIEALNAGAPVVATRHASIPEYVFDGHNGLLVPEKSPAAIAEAIETLMDKKKWREMAMAARRSYETMFTPETIKRQLLVVLKGGDPEDG
jgi:glycosyltransferase involved in cell wall biosynthesis